jgi:hypothetical protein
MRYQFLILWTLHIFLTYIHHFYTSILMCSYEICIFTKLNRMFLYRNFYKITFWKKKLQCSYQAWSRLNRSVHVLFCYPFLLSHLSHVSHHSIHACPIQYWYHLVIKTFHSVSFHLMPFDLPLWSSLIPFWQDLLHSNEWD